MDFLLTGLCSRELTFGKASLTNQLTPSQILPSFKVFPPCITDYKCIESSYQSRKRSLKNSHWKLNSRISISEWAFITVLTQKDTRLAEVFGDISLQIGNQQRWQNPSHASHDRPRIFPEYSILILSKMTPQLFLYE